MRIIVISILLLLLTGTACADTYFYAGTQILMVREATGSVTMLYQDRLGSEISTKYLPFGQIIEIGERFGFTGKERDQSGLHYFAARYYDSSIGRFTSIDPVKENHAYAYVHNNPVNRIDPTGKDDFHREEVEDIVMKFVATTWEGIIAEHVPEIISVSETLDIPPQLMLAAILVEDIRSYSPELIDKLSADYIKNMIRNIVPNGILEATGRSPNAAKGNTGFGRIRGAAIDGAKHFFEDQGYPKNSLERNPQSHIEHLGVILKAHLVYWRNDGYDIFEAPFTTIDSFADRVGIAETLNCLACYKRIRYDDQRPAIFIKERTNWPVIPHDSPALGGTPLWGRTNFGEVSSAFVSSGEADRLLETYGPPP